MVTLCLFRVGKKNKINKNKKNTQKKKKNSSNLVQQRAIKAAVCVKDLLGINPWNDWSGRRCSLHAPLRTECASASSGARLRAWALRVQTRTSVFGIYKIKGRSRPRRRRSRAFFFFCCPLLVGSGKDRSIASVSAPGTTVAVFPRYNFNVS